MSLQKLGLAL